MPKKNQGREAWEVLLYSYSEATGTAAPLETAAVDMFSAYKTSKT